MGRDSSDGKMPASDRLCIENASPNTTTKHLLLLQGNTPTMNIMFSSGFPTDVSSSSTAATLVSYSNVHRHRGSPKGGGALQVSPPHTDRKPHTVGTLVATLGVKKSVDRRSTDFRRWLIDKMEHRTILSLSKMLPQLRRAMPKCLGRAFGAFVQSHFFFKW